VIFRVYVNLPGWTYSSTILHWLKPRTKKLRRESPARAAQLLAQHPTKRGACWLANIGRLYRDRVTVYHTGTHTYIYIICDFNSSKLKYLKCNWMHTYPHVIWTSLIEATKWIDCNSKPGFPWVYVTWNWKGYFSSWAWNRNATAKAYDMVGFREFPGPCNLFCGILAAENPCFFFPLQRTGEYVPWNGDFRLNSCAHSQIATH